MVLVLSCLPIYVVSCVYTLPEWTADFFFFVRGGGGLEVPCLSFFSGTYFSLILKYVLNFTIMKHNIYFKY